MIKTHDYRTVLPHMITALNVLIENYFTNSCIPIAYSSIKIYR